MKKGTTIFTIILFVITIIMNYISAMGILPGSRTQEEVSNIFFTPLTPASFTFSIWGVIYILFFISLIYFLVKVIKDNQYSHMVNSTAIMLWISMICNILWLVAFSYMFILLSTLIIFIYFLSLLFFTKVLGDERDKINDIVLLAFGLHLGWLTVATILNVYALMVQYNFIEMRNIPWAVNTLRYPVYWGIAGIVVSFLSVTLLSKVTNNEFVFLSVIWAFFGIISNRFLGFYPSYFNIMLMVLMAIMFILFVVKFARRMHNKSIEM